MPHIYKRGEIYWLRYKHARGDTRLSLRTRSEPEANRRAAAEIVRIDRENDTSRVRWEDAVVHWSTVASCSLSPKTFQRYQVSLAQVTPLLLGRFLDELDRPLFAQIVSARRLGRVSNATLRRDFTAIASVLDYAIDEGHIGHNAARTYIESTSRTSLREPDVLIPAPKPADVAYLRDLVDPMTQHLIDFARATGMRQGEIIALEHRDVEPEGRCVINRAKGNKTRVIDLTALGALEIYERIPRFRGVPHVFHWPTDPRMRIDPSKKFKDKVEGAQIRAQSEGVDFRPFRFHDLRHLAAVEHLRRGMSLYRLSAVLGHSSVKVTELYLRMLTPEEVDRVRATAHNANV